MKRAVTFTCIVTVLLAGCTATATAPAPTHAPDSATEDSAAGPAPVLPTARPAFPYVPPPEVAAEDRDACDQRAREPAMRAGSDVSDRAAALFGAIGALVQVARVKARMNAAYEKAMKACLRDQGYGIEE